MHDNKSLVCYFHYTPLSDQLAIRHKPLYMFVRSLTLHRAHMDRDQEQMTQANILSGYVN